jgi:hypothetical protein
VDLLAGEDVNDFRPVESQRQLRQRLRERRRVAWLAAAEEHWRRRTGRPMTTEELRRELLQYQGDV